MLRLAALPGLGLALCEAFGASLRLYGRVRWASPLLWSAALGLFVVCTLFFCALWRALPRAEERLNLAKPRFAGLFSRGWLLWLLMLLCWLPCWLAIFPGNFVYDTVGEYDQCAFGFDPAFPRLHSWLNISVINRVFGLTGSYAAGAALFTALHMVFLALLFAWMLQRLCRLGVNARLLLLSLCWCALFPTVQMLAVSPIRDLMFAGNLTALCFLLLLLRRDRAAFWRDRRLPLLLGCVSALTVLSRDNIAPALSVMILLAFSLPLVLRAGKGNRKAALLFAFSALLLWGGLSAFLGRVCRPPAENAGSPSALAALTQPITRCYALHGQDWSEAERARYAEFFITEGQTYVENDGDVSLAALKSLRSEGGYGDFLRLWLGLFRRYPATYLDAWLAHTRSLWLPGDGIDGYVRSGSYTDAQSAYFYYRAAESGPARTLLRLDALRGFYERVGLHTRLERIPVLRQLFSLGFHFWLLLGTLFYLRWRRMACSPLWVLLLYALGNLLDPLMLVRYFAAFYLAFPLLSVSLLQPGLLYADRRLATTEIG